MDNCSVQNLWLSYGLEVLSSKKRSESTSVLGFDSFCPVTDNPTGRGGSRGVTLAVPVM